MSVPWLAADNMNFVLEVESTDQRDGRE